MGKTTPSTRGQIIALAKFGEGSPNFARISQKVGVHQSTVRRIILRYRARGHVYNAKRTGRPPKLSPQAETRLIRAIERDPKAPYDVFGPIVGVSTSTVRNIAAKYGIHSRICRRKPYISPTNQAKRLKYTVDNAQQDWTRVMFTDEAAFEIGESLGRQRVHRRAGTAYHPRHIAVKFRGGAPLHVWGAIVHGVKLPLVRFRLQPRRTINGVVYKADTITSKVYIDQILNGPLSDYTAALLLTSDVLVVEDGASPHTSKATKAARQRTLIPNLTHPPSSPDLNPIETCWAIVKAGLRRLRRHISSHDQLWSEVERLWNEIPQAKVDEMIMSMPERLQAVRDANGLHTPY